MFDPQFAGQQVQPSAGSKNYREEPSVMSLSPPFDGGGAAGPGSRTAVSLAPLCRSHPCGLVWLI
jgi:hypothetical protein